jgi:hypothetical protein
MYTPPEIPNGVNKLQATKQKKADKKARMTSRTKA